jgi:hypothetical protein
MLTFQYVVLVYFNLEARSEHESAVKYVFREKNTCGSEWNTVCVDRKYRIGWNHGFSQYTVPAAYN